MDIFFIDRLPLAGTYSEINCTTNKDFWESPRYDIILITESKASAPRRACMSVEKRLYDSPLYEEEVGQGPHEFRIIGRIVGAICGETIRNHF